MHDFYNAWEQEEAYAEQGDAVRRDRLVDGMERFLRKALSVDDTDIFTMAKARQLFDRMLTDRPISEQMEDKCGLYVKKANGRYHIKLVLLDKNNQFVRMTSKSYYGYELQANYIDETVSRYMGGQELRIMNNPNQ